MKILILAFFFLLTACFADKPQQPKAQQTNQALPVPAMKVKVEPLKLSWQYPAQVSGYREVQIRPRVHGIILERGFEPGAQVKKDQSLYLIDPEPYRVALNTALAEQKAANARLKQANRNLHRVKPLVESKAVSQIEFDEATAEQELAQAQLDLAKARLVSARLDLEYARVKSPVNGFVSRSLHDEGSLVSGPADLLTTVTQIDKVYLNFGIPQADYEVMRSKAIQLPDGGKLSVFVEGASDSQSAALLFQDVRVTPSTGTVDARAVFENQKGQYVPGQFVRVNVRGAILPNAVLVPQRAVLQNPQGGKIVMTVTPDNQVAPKQVEAGQWQGDQWVISSGLQEGDVVITDGFMKVQPGATVEPIFKQESGSSNTAVDHSS